MMEISAAMVLAAGRGERMRPLSEVVPKPALPLADGPVVGSAMRLAAAAGADRVVVNTWYLGRRMEMAVAEVVDMGVPVDVSSEDTLMGTAGGLACARDRGLLGTTGPVLVINGDGIHDLDLGPLVEGHARGRNAVTLGLLPHPDPTRWSRVTIDGAGRVSGFRAAGPPDPGERPFHYPGVMMVSRKALDGLPATAGDTPDRLWYPALDKGLLGGVVISGGWREVGTPLDYRSVIADEISGRTIIHESAVVAPTAGVDSSLIGRGARIGEHAVIRNSVVAEGAIVAGGAVITDSVLLGALHTRVDEEIHDRVRTGPPHRG